MAQVPACSATNVRKVAHLSFGQKRICADLATLTGDLLGNHRRENDNLVVVDDDEEENIARILNAVQCHSELSCHKD